MDLTKLSRHEKVLLMEAMQAKEDSKKYNKLATMFPDKENPWFCKETNKWLSREDYPKHIQFIIAGKTNKQRAIIAANRIGKSEMGAYEVAIHLTGLYPHWWEGKRFNEPISAWAAGKTNETTRDIVQEKLLGPNNKVEANMGTGMIPKELIVRVTTRPGVPDAIQDIYVRHVPSGGVSKVSLKSYQQGRGSFEGTAQHVIWLDEEPDEQGMAIYEECMMRTMTTKGIIFLTFTPLLGISEVVQSFLPDGTVPENGLAGESKFVIQASWEDAPHLSEEEKQTMLANLSPHQLEARTKGFPSIGSGKIYPIQEDDILVEPFKIPETWPRCYAMDVGWKRTAVLWAAIDPNTDTVYLYDEYYQGRMEPVIHAAAVKAHGDWMYGAIDYAGGTMVDGHRVATTQQYRQLGLNVLSADKSVDAGLLCTYRRICEGKLKVFNTLTNWLKEFRVYRRDEKGKIVKTNDHLMDAMRYLIMTALNVAQVPPDPDDEEFYTPRNSSISGRSEITGY